MKNSTALNTPKLSGFVNALQMGRAAGIAARGGSRGVTKPMVAGGRKFTPPSDPPSYKNSPWNQITVLGNDYINTGYQAGTVTLNDLRTAFQNQLGITGSISYMFRIRRVKAYHRAPIDAQTYLGIEPFDLANGNIRTEIVDSSSRSEFARVGFEWPLTDESVCLYTATQGSTKLIQWEVRTTVTTDTSLLTYWDILWKNNTFDIPARSMFPNVRFPALIANESSGPGATVGSVECGTNPDIKDDESAEDSPVSTCCIV